MIFLFLLYYYAFENTDIGFERNSGYRIKLAGDEELFLVKLGGSIRLVPNNQLEKLTGLNSVVMLERFANNGYLINFCGSLLSRKSTDPGIIPVYEDNFMTRWRIEEYNNGYRIKNDDKCLVKLDSASVGYYLNWQPCDENYPNVFSILKMGNIMFYCKDTVDDVCKNSGYEKKGGKYSDKDPIYSDKRERRRRENELGDPNNDNDFNGRYPDRYRKNGNLTSSNHVKTNEYGYDFTHHDGLTEDQYHHH